MRINYGTITANLSACPAGSGGSPAENSVTIWLRRRPRIERFQPPSPGSSSSAAETELREELAQRPRVSARSFGANRPVGRFSSRRRR
jgi:hypothetical protein